MNVDHLKLFVRVAATLNISQAGKELGLSAAVSSAYLNKLEAGLGVRLLHRTTRQVSLTEDGHAFLPHAQDVLERIDVANASVGVGSIRPQGNLRVTAPASFGRMHLIPALKGFMQRYPELTLDLRLSDTIVDLVEGGYDVAIRDAALNDSSLIARRLAHDKRVVVASPDYLQSASDLKVPEDLHSHSCLTLPGLDQWTFKVGDKTSLVKVKSMLQTDNGEAVRDAAVQGLGLTVSSIWCAYEHLRDGRLVTVLDDYPLLSDTAIWAVYPTSRQLPPKVRFFIDFLLDYYGETPYWEATVD